MNCIVISSSTLVVAVFIPGGSFAAFPNLFHFYIYLNKNILFYFILLFVQQQLVKLLIFDFDMFLLSIKAKL